VGDRVLLSSSPKNIEECVRIAVGHGLGIELMAFAYPDLLDGDWRSVVERYKVLLEPVPGILTMHGPFMDMASGSPDQQINEVCKGRFRHALRIAHDLGVQIVVLHANFIASIHTEEYRSGWQRRNVTFHHLHAALLTVTAVAAALYPMQVVARLPIAATLRNEVLS